MKKPVQILILLAALITGAANAQPPQFSVPPMRGIRIATVLPPQLDANPANVACGLTQQLIENAILQAVRAAGLTAEPQASAQPFRTDTPGLYLVPVLATMRSGVYGCISWVGLRAQSAHVLTLPSTQQRSTHQILYWDSGVLLADSESGHAEAVAKAMSGLAQSFAGEWATAQK